MANEAELMRDCAPLYISVALESFSTFVMGLTFLYLLLLITNKGRLQKPGLAFRKFVLAELSTFFKDLSDAVGKWKHMPTIPLEQRFATCRKMNQAMCSFQLILAALTISRWLHIGNVNGFRYLGYSITCPPMQAQMIMIIAPIVPFYKCVVVFTYCVTTLMELSAWAGSLTEGDLFANMDEAFDTGDVSLLEPQKKFYAILPGVSILCFLLFIQLPALALLFCCRKDRLEELGCPPGYLKLLFICQVTWIAFPVWWLLGYEGLAILEDTKLNAIGFATLNVISKATFSVHMIGISGKYRKILKAKEREQNHMRRENSNESGSASTSDETEAREAAPPVESWFVRVLRPYDAEMTLPEKWQKLEPDFKGYLMGCGVTPAMYDDMGFEERKAHHGRFTDVCDGIYAPSTTTTSFASKGAAEERKVAQAAPIPAAFASEGGRVRSFPLGGSTDTQGQVADANKVKGVLKMLDEARASNRDQRDDEVVSYHSSPFRLLHADSKGLNGCSPRNGTSKVAVAFEDGVVENKEVIADEYQPDSAQQQYETLQQQVQELLLRMQQESLPGSEIQKHEEVIKPRGGPFSSIVCCSGGYAKSAAPSAISRGPVMTEKNREPHLEHISASDLMMGQIVSTVHGVTGRVCQRTRDGVKVMTPGGAVQHVDVKDVTVLTVSVLGAKGLARQLGQQDAGQFKAVCTTELVGKPSCKASSTPMKVSQELSWNHEGKLIGYAPGDSIQVSVVGETTSGEERHFGSALLSASSLRGGSFEGDVRLISKDGQMTSASVMIIIMAFQVPQVQ